jgi:hypothetical protein
VSDLSAVVQTLCSFRYAFQVYSYVHIYKICCVFLDSFLNITPSSYSKYHIITMPRFNSPQDSASLFYRDYIPSPPPPTSRLTLLFLHGWPMSSLMFTHLILPLSQDYNLRCIAPDRRGFGNSDWNGTIKLGTNSPEYAKKAEITFETFAGDVAFLIESLDIGSFICICASMGCGESLLLRERSEYARKNCKVYSPFSFTFSLRLLTE